MRKSIIATGAVLAAALTLAGCGAGSSGPAGQDVLFGIVEPLTGTSATFGEEARRGADLAAKEINARDGRCYDGRAVKLLYEDDKGTPEGGVTAVQKLMTRDRVTAIGGGANSSVVLAEASVTKDQIVQINAGAQADAITEDGGSLLFQINNTVTQNSDSYNKYIIDTIKPKSLVYMGEDTAFNAGTFETLKKDLDAAGVPVPDSAKYQADTNDFTPILNRLKATGADVLYIADAFPARLATLMQQVRQVGGFGKILISSGVVSQGTVEAAGEPINGVITGDIYVPAIDTPANKAFVEAFGKEYPGRLPGKSELVNYESVHALCSAVAKAGSTTDQKAIAKALSELSFETPRGTLAFGDKGRAIAPSFFIQEVRNGRLEVLAEVK